MKKLNQNPFLNRSANFSRKFSYLDTLMNQMAEYLTFEEVDKLLKDLEIKTKSKIEGNWSMSDSTQFLRDALGADRYDMIRNLWILDHQNMIENYNQESDLREIWINKISLREVPQDIALADPESHLPIKVPK